MSHMEEATSLPSGERQAASVADLQLPAPRRQARRRPIWDTAFWSVLFFLVAQTWVVQGYKVYGSCMEPNLFTGERLLGVKGGLERQVQRGEVVVFYPPYKPDSAFIKRVIGLPGEMIEIRNSRVYVDGRPLDEPYLRRTWHDDRAPERVPAGMVYVLGDNRDNSNDSRMWGELPIKNIQAKAWLRYWPLNRFEWIR